MTIAYRRDVPLETDDVIRVFSASTIRRPTGDPERIAAMFKNSNLVFSAWDGERLVAVARALTDFRFACYLSDLVVDEAYQRRGIGKKLLDLVKEAVGGETAVILLSAAEAMDYYPAMGFEKSDRCFIINRRV